MLFEHVLAFCMGLHKRLGENSPCRVLCSEILHHHIFDTYKPVAIRVFIKNHLHTLHVSECRVPGSNPVTFASSHPPTENSMFSALHSRPLKHSSRDELLRAQQNHFLRTVVGHLFGRYVIMMQELDNVPKIHEKDYRVVMWESLYPQTVSRDEMIYIQGMIDGFLDTTCRREYKEAHGPLTVSYTHLTLPTILLV